VSSGVISTGRPSPHWYFPRIKSAHSPVEPSILPLVEHPRRRFKLPILDPYLDASVTLDVANPVRPKFLGHDEIFAVQRNEPDFDFPRQTADAADCRNEDVRGSDFPNSKPTR
jgi:hypothetical protein